MTLSNDIILSHSFKIFKTIHLSIETLVTTTDIWSETFSYCCFREFPIEKEEDKNTYFFRKKMIYNLD
jgi:hypothetical protein